MNWMNRLMIHRCLGGLFSLVQGKIKVLMADGLNDKGKDR